MSRSFLLALLLVACKGNDNDSPAPAPTPSSAPAPADSAQTTPPEAPVETKTGMPPAAEIMSLVKANNHFALELWAKAGTGNLAISPVSISTALAMAWAGAKGETAAEMRKAMHLEGEPDIIVSQWARLAHALQDDKRPLKLKIANRLYGDAHYQFDTTYFTITRKVFDAPLEMVNFIAESEEVRQKINAWVAEKTEQRIKDLLPPRAVDKETRLIIVNAIYFLADWSKQFEPTATREQDFHVSAAQKKRVPTMHQTNVFMHAKADGAALVELPYKGGSASMYLVLPDRVDGLAQLERELPTKLKTLQGKLADTNVSIALPKFMVDPPAPMRLAQSLKALGIKQAFDPKLADFTGIAKPASDSDRLMISEVLHKAFVKVDEKGTEAAAATAIAMPRGGRPSQESTPFVADHPFLFLIVDRGSGLILFIGRVVDPS